MPGTAETRQRASRKWTRQPTGGITVRRGRSVAPGQSVGDESEERDNETEHSGGVFSQGRHEVRERQRERVWCHQRAQSDVNPPGHAVYGQRERNLAEDFKASRAWSCRGRARRCRYGCTRRACRLAVHPVLSPRTLTWPVCHTVQRICPRRSTGAPAAGCVRVVIARKPVWAAQRLTSEPGRWQAAEKQEGVTRVVCE